MTARCALVGTIAPSSQPAAVRVRGVPVVPTRTPIAAQLTPLGVALADLLASGVEPCPVCNRYACDCDEWHEIMNGIDAAERGELGDYESELPY